MEGGSPDRESVVSGTKKSSISSSGRVREEFLHRFIDSQAMIANLEDWFQTLSENSFSFDVPFELIDLQKFDYALESVSFQQLIRMPSAGHASPSGSMEATSFLAIEDFLHTSIKGLWEAFWDENEPLPLNVACLYETNLKFYQAEKAIANGKLGGLCATAVMLNNPRHPHGKWYDILELALLRPDIKIFEKEGDIMLPSLSVLGEALFYAVRILLSRSLRGSKIPSGLNSIFVILADCQYGGVVKVEGDLAKMEFDVNNVYQCASEWIRTHSRVAVSSFDRIWNKLGNANWGDIGALQVLFATFQSMVQYVGMPKNSIEDLAADHSSRLQTRRNERRLGEIGINGNGLYKLEKRSVSPEIVEVQEEEPVNIEPRRSVKLEVGSVLVVEDSIRQKSYRVDEVLSDGQMPYYIASAVEDPGTALFLYVGSHPSQLEPAWEDMNLWYQVQRQTKVFSVMKQNGLSSKYLPEPSMSGRIVHPGPCSKPGSGVNCDNPWCGTPILVTTPVGKTVADMVRSGQFGSDEAIRCCHDCLSALATAASAGIRHGDIRPENIIHVTSSTHQHPYFVLVGWGHAVLEERDRPAMNLHFSSTYALQEGKLCSASDAESLIYLLYFSSGGDVPDLDSVEGALEWRDMVWSKRSIQQNLGEISAVLKAFADYVDSLCGTPYSMDYEIWLRRLKRHMHENGKEINVSS